MFEDERSFPLEAGMILPLLEVGVVFIHSSPRNYRRSAYRAPSLRAARAKSRIPSLSADILVTDSSRHIGQDDRLPICDRAYVSVKTSSAFGT